MTGPFCVCSGSMREEKDQIAKYSTRDAMQAFDRSRGNVEAYAKLGVARPSGPLRGRGRCYTYFDLLRVGIASHIESVYGVYPHNLSRYTSQITDERLEASSGLLRFRELGGEVRILEVSSAKGTMEALQSSRVGLTIDFIPIRDQLNAFLLDQYGSGEGGQ